MRDYKTIPGWMDFEQVYRSVVNFCPKQATFVEVGSWQGRSAAFMCSEIARKEGQKVIEFYCVDTWKGSNDQQEDVAALGGDVFPTFEKNMEDHKGRYVAIQGRSVDAAKRFADATLDFVYIDASHEYEDVCDDITAWANKVKPGGILAGHDLFWGHPDGTMPVLRAVREYFPMFKVWTTSWLIVRPE